MAKELINDPNEQRISLFDIWDNCTDPEFNDRYSAIGASLDRMSCCDDGYVNLMHYFCELFGFSNPYDSIRIINMQCVITYTPDADVSIITDGNYLVRPTSLHLINKVVDVTRVIVNPEANYVIQLEKNPLLEKNPDRYELMGASSKLKADMKSLPIGMGYIPMYNTTIYLKNSKDVITKKNIADIILKIFEFYHNHNTECDLQDLRSKFKQKTLDDRFKKLRLSSVYGSFAECKTDEDVQNYIRHVCENEDTI